MGQEVERAADLLGNAYADGSLSAESKEALLTIGDIGAEVAQALGGDPLTGELLLVTVLVDDSPSIGGHVEEVQIGHNVLIEAFSGNEGTEVLFHTRRLNGGVLSPYRPFDNAIKLTPANYRLVASTPLYAQSIITLGTVIAKAKEQEALGRRVRTYTLILTDGEDTASRQLSAENVRALVADMLDFATNHIVAGMGIGNEDTFTRIFSAMGVPRRHIHTASATPEDIRATFNTIARSLQLAASNEAAFRQLASGSVSGRA